MMLVMNVVDLIVIFRGLVGIFFLVEIDVVVLIFCVFLIFIFLIVMRVSLIIWVVYVWMMLRCNL